MAFKAKFLRVDHSSKVSIKLGYKTAQITLEMPIKQLAVQLTRAAFGPSAHIVGGRNGRHS